MNRTPPADVLRQLRKEVGFGCPIPDCGSPYLYWHHFDPKWNERPHHDPSGMIALCGEHHAKADAGAFTKEQLRALKTSASAHSREIRGRFDWMRRDLLGVAGGNFYYETPVLVQLRGAPIIWFNRDEEGYFLLNIRMPTISHEPRLVIEDNFWILSGDPEDLEVPPSGRVLRARYRDGDELAVGFLDLDSLGAARARFPDCAAEGWGVPFPITAVEVQLHVGGTQIDFGPRETKLPGAIVIRNCFMKRCRVGISLQ